MRDLPVYPQDTATDHVTDRSLPADQQLEEAVRANEATTMVGYYYLKFRYGGTSGGIFRGLNVTLVFSHTFMQNIQHKHLSKALSAVSSAGPCKILCGEKSISIYRT
jgi:hypothetical protein